MSNWLNKCLLQYWLQYDPTCSLSPHIASLTQLTPLHLTQYTLTQLTLSLNTHPLTPRGAPSDHPRSPQSHDLRAGREDGGVAVYGLYPDSTPLYSSSATLHSADELTNLGGWGGEGGRGGRGAMEKKKKGDVVVGGNLVMEMKVLGEGCLALLTICICVLVWLVLASLHVYVCILVLMSCTAVLT